MTFFTRFLLPAPMFCPAKATVAALSAAMPEEMKPSRFEEAELPATALVPKSFIADCIWMFEILYIA